MMLMQEIVERHVKDCARNVGQYQRERAVCEITQLIESMMEGKHVTKDALAKATGWMSARWLKRVLDDGDSENENISVGTAAEILAVLGMELHFSATPITLGKPPT